MQLNVMRRVAIQHMLPSFRISQRPAFTRTLRIQKYSNFYSSLATSDVSAPDHLSDGERKVFDMIQQELKPTELEVQDISGGCGSMYALNIVSAEFAGLPVIKQHRLVNKVLGEEIKKWHGVQLRTSAP